MMIATCEHISRIDELWYHGPTTKIRQSVYSIIYNTYGIPNRYKSLLLGTTTRFVKVAHTANYTEGVMSACRHFLYLTERDGTLLVKGLLRMG
jgi:hypothetical protein